MAKSKSKAKVVKRTVKYLAVAPDITVVRSVLSKAPDGVIRAISNAALNARQGSVTIPPQYKQLFRRHNRHFEYLTDPRYPIANKRQLCIQKGGALPIIAPLIGTVLGSLGAEFISRMIRKNE